MFPYFELIRQILTPIVILFCISKAGSVYRFLFAAKPKPQLKRPYTTYDRYADYLLLISFVGFIVFAFIPRSNFFREIGAETDSQSFHIRRQFNQYMTNKYPNYQPGKSQDLEVRTLEKMCDLMVGTAYKNIYLTYGPALQDCSWCRQEVDFLVYSIPRVLVMYLPFLVLVGLCTMNWRRQAYRMWFGIGFVLAFIAEIGILNVSEPMHNLWFQETQYNAIHTFRCILMGVSFFILYLLQSNQWTDKDLLAKMVETAQHIRFRNQASDGIAQVVFKDNQLKTVHITFQEEIEKRKKAFHNNSTTKNVKRSVMLKYNMDMLHSMARQWTESVFRYFDIVDQDNHEEQIVPWDAYETQITKNQNK